MLSSIDHGQKHIPPEQFDKVMNLALGALFEIYGISESTHLTLTKGWE